MNESNFFALSQKDIDTIIPETQLANRDKFKSHFKVALCERITSSTPDDSETQVVESPSNDNTNKAISYVRTDSLLVIEQFKNVEELFSDCNNLLTSK